MRYNAAHLFTQPKVSVRRDFGVSGIIYERSSRPEFFCSYFVGACAAPAKLIQPLYSNYEKKPYLCCLFFVFNGL